MAAKLGRHCDNRHSISAVSVARRSATHYLTFAFRYNVMLEPLAWYEGTQATNSFLVVWPDRHASFTRSVLRTV